MRKSLYLFLIIFFISFVVNGCGEGDETRGKEGLQDHPFTEKKEIEIRATTEEEAVERVRAFIQTELDVEEFSGLYIEREPKTHLVLLIQADTPLEKVAEQLQDYSKETNDVEKYFPVKLKSAKQSHKLLEETMEQLNDNLERLTKGQRPITGMSLNEIKNRIDLYVSTKEDINEVVFDELFVNREDLIHIVEGSLKTVDDKGLPTHKPHIVGEIMEIESKTGRLLIDNEIFFSIQEYTIIKDEHGEWLTKVDLKVGDQVAVWTDMGILESFPAQGTATVIQRK